MKITKSGEKEKMKHLQLDFKLTKCVLNVKKSMLEVDIIKGQWSLIEL